MELRRSASCSVGSRYQYLGTGMTSAVRLTTDVSYYDDHPDSTELWSPGSPPFPEVEEIAGAEEVGLGLSDLSILLRGNSAR